MNRRNLFLGAAAALTAAAPVRAETRGYPSAAERARFPNVAVRDHEGREHRFYDDLVRGRVVTINFMYAECEGICPMQTANLKQVQKLFGDRVGRDIFMYSITLKPREDTPEKLAHYVDMHGIGPGWRFLTGAPDDIEQLRRSLGFTDPDPERDRDTSSHIGIVLYGSDALNRWGGCPARSKPSLIHWNLMTLIGPAYPYVG
jgi:protein SCO1/2